MKCNSCIQLCKHQYSQDMKHFRNPKEFLVPFDSLMPTIFISWAYGSAAQLGVGALYCVKVPAHVGN